MKFGGGLTESMLVSDSWKANGSGGLDEFVEDGYFANDEEKQDQEQKNESDCKRINSLLFSILHSALLFVLISRREKGVVCCRNSLILLCFVVDATNATVGSPAGQ